MSGSSTLARTVVSGIDLGASTIWVVGLEGERAARVTFAERISSEHLDEVALLVGTSTVIAIDAPEALSRGSHVGDLRLSRKFQRARCAEVALRRAGIAVPFATPLPGEALPAWMVVGFSTWEAASDSGNTVLETYPHGIFWRLAGRQLLHKQREEGRIARRQLLASHLDLPVGASFWPHDALDALACAVLAWQASKGSADRIDCGNDVEWRHHDGSAIWLPRSSPARVGSPLASTSPSSGMGGFSTLEV